MHDHHDNAHGASLAAPAAAGLSHKDEHHRAGGTVVFKGHSETSKPDCADPAAGLQGKHGGDQ